MGITLSRQGREVKQLIKEALGSDGTLYWDHVKLYNLDIPTQPDAVTYSKTPQQVASIVKSARRAGLAVQAKSGGHSYCNFSSPDGGIIVDLRNFKNFSMDQTAWQATTGGGMLLGELTEAMYNPHKRAMTHGEHIRGVQYASEAYIRNLPTGRVGRACNDRWAGFKLPSLRGGVGSCVGGRGCSCRRQHTESDLFWALKGAGASFGIRTEFVLRTERAPGDTVQYKHSFTSGTWAEIAEVFKSWQRFIADRNSSLEFTTTATITSLGLTGSGTFYGTREEFEKLSLKPDLPLKHTGEKTAVSQNWIDVLMHQAEEVALKLGGGISAHAYSKTLTFNGEKDNFIPDATVDKLFDYIKRTDKGTLIWFLIFDLAGGKVNEVPMAKTAYAHRDALYYLQSYAISDKLFSGVSRTTKDFLAGFSDLIVTDMKADGVFTDYGAYPGYVDLELGASAQKLYWRSNLPKLDEIKKKYDPDQVFRNPQSVRPAGMGNRTGHGL